MPRESSTRITTVSEPILASSADWEIWFHIVKRLAVNLDCWNSIDPDSDNPALIEEPDKPDPTDYNSPDGTFESIPANMRTRYLDANRLFHDEMKEYRSRRKAIAEVDKYVNTHISVDLILVIKEKETVHDVLRILKQLLSPTSADRYLQVQASYSNAKMFDPRKMNFETWSQTFLTAYSRAEQMSLPDVTGFLAQKDLLRAIKAADQSWAGNLGRDIFRAEKGWTPGQKVPDELEVQEVLSEFLQYYRQTKIPRTANINHGAFAATLNGEEAPIHFRQQSSKNPRKPFKPCLCGDMHFWGQCPYIDPKQRSDNFRFEQKKHDKVQRARGESNTEEKCQKVIERNAATRARRRNPDHRQERRRSGSPVILDGAPRPGHGPAAAVVFCPSSFAAETKSTYPLCDSWILDPGSDIHVCNSEKEFSWKEPASDEDYIIAGGKELRIEAWGEVTITIQTPGGPRPSTLKYVALIPSFFTNLISLHRLTHLDIHFDSGRDAIYRKTGGSNEIVAKLTRHGGHWLMVDRSMPTEGAIHTLSFQAHATNANRSRTSHIPRKSLPSSSQLRHAILGHAAPEAIDRLPANVIGADASDGKTPGTIDCHECAISKAHRIVSRRLGHELGASRPFETVAIDLIKLDVTGYNGHKYVFHAICLYTKMHFVFTVKKKDKATLLAVITKLDRLIKRRYRRTVTFIIADDERGYAWKDESVRAYCAQEGITFEIRAPHTAEQNGGAERSGETLIVRARTMRVAANLPLSLAPECYIAAAYILNRTPTRALGWKTPFEAAHGKQPSIAHMHVFGCKAYTLRTRIPRGDKLTERALVGYLVGYDSTNIYRIWIPANHSVVRSRDVTFRDDRFYDKDDPEPLLSGENIELITFPEPAEDEWSDDEVLPYTEAADTPEVQYIGSSNIPTGPKPTPQRGNAIPAQEAISRPNNTAANRDAIAGYLSQDFIIPEGSRRSRKQRKLFGQASFSTLSPLAAYWSSFVASSARTRSQRLHRDQLPPEPKWDWEINKLPKEHRFGFLAAMNKEVDALKRQGTMQRVPKDDLDNPEILPLMWVFKYKFDSDGYLIKYKARLVVRGDLQTTEEETYAATLAIRTFRALMALAAAFDLEVRQYDAVNAFTNAKLLRQVYCHPPENFEDSAHIWQLNKALYGLRTSPLLWYKELTKTLEELGLQPVPNVNCLYRNEKIIVFFYVDDIVVLGRPSHTRQLDTFEQQLKRRYEIHVVGDLEFFCGIRIIRDRDEGKIWLCQDDYIRKLAKQFEPPKGWPDKRLKAPLPLDELVPSEDEKNISRTFRYAQIVGSLGYIANATRPDISKAHSKLSEFLVNPSDRHLSAALQALQYVIQSYNLGIEYQASTSYATSYIVEHEPDPAFYGASDASFADDKDTRKSSQGYIFFLFGGPIDWRATLQRCVTKSTTESELIAASSAGTELIWWWRFFENLGFNPDCPHILYCDNKQTVRLVTTDAPKLKTQLRHVDTHNQWLRQEDEAGSVELRWISTDSQPADGLTKILPPGKHQNWITKLNLVQVTLPEK